MLHCIPNHQLIPFDGLCTLGSTSLGLEGAVVALRDASDGSGGECTGTVHCHLDRRRQQGDRPAAQGMCKRAITLRVA